MIPGTWINTITLFGLMPIAQTKTTTTTTTPFTFNQITKLRECMWDHFFMVISNYINNVMQEKKTKTTVVLLFTGLIWYPSQIGIEK